MNGASGSLDFSNIDIGGTGFNLYDYIGPIDKLNTFAKYKHAIVFNLLYQDDVSGNITGPLKYVRGSTYKAKANYIKNYFFFDYQGLLSSKEYISQTKVLRSIPLHLKMTMFII